MFQWGSLLPPVSGLIGPGCNLITVSPTGVVWTWREATRGYHPNTTIVSSVQTQTQAESVTACICFSGLQTWSWLKHACVCLSPFIWPCLSCLISSPPRIPDALFFYLPITPLFSPLCIFVSKLQSNSFLRAVLLEFNPPSLPFQPFFHCEDSWLRPGPLLYGDDQLIHPHACPPSPPLPSPHHPTPSIPTILFYHPSIPPHVTLSASFPHLPFLCVSLILYSQSAMIPEISALQAPFQNYIRS